MPIQRYEVDPLDGEYRSDSGDWVQYEDHLAEMENLREELRKRGELVVSQRDRLVTAVNRYTVSVKRLIEDPLNMLCHDDHTEARSDVFKVINEIQPL